MMLVKTIVLHHTATPGLGDGSSEWQAIKKACQTKRGGDYQGDYHYGIGPKGDLFEGQLERNPCWHCGDDTINHESLAIACIGNFELNPMGKAQKNRLIQTVRELQRRFPRAVLKLHKEIVPTLCPGQFYPTIQEITSGGTEMIFSDLSLSDIFYPAICAVVKKGVMHGPAKEPSDPMTRSLGGN